ncbi:hypothetical protein JQC92_09925 [Shewanella sp. 202IG2-18]|uniref:hypothetical protein n=1 Tax=Parashewanella hymeniacidonis TaxID=2807618 RepID=UPI00195FF1A4|nr:hypothetical protein [Parashewanella hymeniacidonis]MBM7072346.1 hypothetical protein [Parashewanella hymeniacidonis]
MTKAEQKSDKKLDQLIDDLPRKYPTPKSSWQQLESRLDVITSNESKSKLLNLKFGVAASILIGFLSLTLIQQINFEKSESLVFQSENRLEKLIDTLNQQHLSQIKAIEQSQLKPVNLTQQNDFKGGLLKLREAQTSIINELKREPSDKQLWDLWLWTQGRELELLKQHSKIQQMETIKTI